MRKVFMAAVFLMAFALTGCDSDPKVLAPFEKEALKIGIDDAFAPIGFRDADENIIGFDIDLAKEVARRLGVKAEFVPINWDNKEAELNSGNIDLIWNGLDITDNRKEYMIFSKPYMDNRQVIVVKAGNTQNIHSVNDLEGKVVGTQAGSSSNDCINEHKDLRDKFAAFKTYSNYEEAFEELDKASVDALICDEIVGRYEIIRNQDRFEIIEATVGSVTEIAVGFNKNNTELRDKVQLAFNEMVKDGTAQKISVKWFGADLIKLRR